MRLSCTLSSAVVLASTLAGFATPAGSQTVVSAEPFHAVSLDGGGEVILRHGTTYRVTVIEGTDCADIRVEDDRLMIEHRSGCSRHDLIVEVVAPGIGSVAVSNGGIIRSAGTFPPREKLQVAVESGGIIDLRSMKAGAVTAAVQEGGRILTRPGQELSATVANGGAITYWGKPSVRSTVHHGGVVYPGKPADADKPLHELGDVGPMAVPPVPPVPPIPPTPPSRTRGTLL